MREDPPSQASHFCMTQDPKARLIDESLDLVALYGGAVGEETVHAVVLQGLARDARRCGELGVEYHSLAADEIRSLAATYGTDLRIVATGVDEECERELENERELERERELQVPRQSPRTPQKWDFAQLLEAASPRHLPELAGVMDLESAISAHLDKALLAIPWERTKIYVTEAFVNTVSDKQQGCTLGDLSSFMRPVDAVVVFPNAEVLLLSEWEADHVLSLMWATTSVAQGPFLVNLAYLRAAADEQRPTAEIRLRVPPPVRGSIADLSMREPAQLSELTVAGLQLLAGETMFGTENRRGSVKMLVESSARAKKAARQLVELRGKQHMISRSDLELICNLDID